MFIYYYKTTAHENHHALKVDLSTIVMSLTPLINTHNENHKPLPYIYTLLMLYDYWENNKNSFTRYKYRTITLILHTHLRKSQIYP